MPIGIKVTAIDHGDLLGLADDDHTQYLLATTEWDAIVDGIGTRPNHFATLQAAVDSAARVIFVAVDIGSEATVQIRDFDDFFVPTGQKVELIFSIKPTFIPFEAGSSISMPNIVCARNVRFQNCFWDTTTVRFVDFNGLLPGTNVEFVTCRFHGGGSQVFIPNAPARFTFLGCAFTSCVAPFEASGSTPVFVTACQFVACTGTFVLKNSSNLAQIVGTVFSGNSPTDFVVDANGGQNTQISGCLFSANTGLSVVRLGLFSSLSGNTFTGTSQSSPLNHYALLNGRGNVVSGNVFDSSPRRSCVLAKETSELITGNAFLITSLLTVDTTTDLNEDLAIGETDVDVVSASVFEPGDYIHIDSETMEITSIAGNTLTVIRGVNTTTDAVHSNGADIFRGPGTGIKVGGTLGTSARGAIIVSNSFIDKTVTNTRAIGIQIRGYLNAANREVIMVGNTFQNTVAQDLDDPVHGEDSTSQAMANKGIGSRGPILVPELDNDQTLGADLKRFSNIFTRAIDILNNFSFKSGTGFALTFDHAITANRTLTIPDATDTVVLLALAQTLINKTLTSPIINGATLNGILDAGAATSFELPNSATPVVDAAGEIALDTSIASFDPGIKFHDGANEQTVIALRTSELSVTDNDVIVYDSASGRFRMVAQGERGLVSYFSLEDGNANDSAGSNDGTVVGATATVNGRIGEAFSFDGTNDNITINTVLTNSLSTTTTGTWSAWVKLVDATPSEIKIITSFSDTSANEFIHLRIKTTGELLAKTTDAGVAQWTLETDAAVFADDTWVHVAVTHDGTAPVLYVDGIAVAQTFTVATDKTKWFFDLTDLDNGRIGNRNVNSGGETNHFNGVIDEVKFYNRALSAVEIETEYLRGKNHLDKSQDLQIGNDNLFVDVSTGKVGINAALPVSKLHIDQASSTAVEPVLTLDQADISEGVIDFLASDRGVIPQNQASVSSVRVELNGTIFTLALYADQ